jgi:hypothetical protein
MADESDPKRLRLIKALDGATPKRPPKPRAKKPPSIDIKGNGNIVGDGNTIHNGPPPRPRVVVPAQPGVEHITDAQAAELKALVDEIVAESAAVKKRPTTHAAIFSALNKEMGATSYKLILLQNFEKAKAFLMQRRAITRAQPSAKKKIDGWRASTIGAIHARCREFADGTARRKAYMVKNMGTDSMKECSDEQLEQVRKHVFGWKRLTTS